MDWTGYGYGDSSHTSDGKYIIAAFRADSNLAWVVDLRSFLHVPELKYKHYAPLEQKHRVTAHLPLYRNMIQGLSQAELTIIDIQRYNWEAYFAFRDQGGKFGEDFDLRTIHDQAANEVIRDSPLSIRPPHDRFQRRATLDLRTSTGWGLEELPDFDPTALRKRSGGKVKDAIVIAARAHSMLSPTEFMELRYLVENPYMRGSFASNMQRISKLGRVFDVEHPKSIPILNELVGQVAEATGLPHHVARLSSLRQPVKEQSSAASDHIQAADFAAGWAADLLVSTDGDFRALARMVRWVALNGVAIPG